MLEFFGCLAGPLGYVLNIIYEWVQNYGIAIIIFTILLKIVMIPISIKQQKTMKMSAKIQEKTNEIKDKYSNNPEKMNQEIMDLYKRENMSPFSGCLSSIVQLVILMSIFLLVGSPLTYMKKVDKQLLDQYVQEVKENNSNVRYQEIAVIKEKGQEDERVNLNMMFLGLDLSNVPSQDISNPKVFVIPALYVLSTIISLKITNITNGTSKKNKEKNDEKQEENPMEQANKNMALIMPVMSVSIA